MDFEQVDWEWVVEELKKKDIGFLRRSHIDDVCWKVFEKQTTGDLPIWFTNEHKDEFVGVLIDIGIIKEIKKKRPQNHPGFNPPVVYQLLIRSFSARV
jgi:hypothetical protein